MSSYNRGFGIIIALAFILFALMMISGCVTIRRKEDPEPMDARAERICKDTGGAWANYTCDYSIPLDSTVAMLGMSADG